MAKQVMLYHQAGVILPDDAKEIHFLLACSVIREQMFESGQVKLQPTFWMTKDTVYAKMKLSSRYYSVRLVLE